MRISILTLRSLWLVVLLLTLCLSAAAGAVDLPPIPPLDSPVVDTTGTLDAAARERLAARARALHERKGSQLQVLIVPTTAPGDIEQYSQRVFDAWKIGRPGVDDGVLVLVAKHDRAVRIQTGYGLEGVIPDAVAHRIIEEQIKPRFRTGDFAGGLDAATAALQKLIDEESLPPPKPSTATPDTGDPEVPGWTPPDPSFFFGIGSLMLGSLFLVALRFLFRLSNDAPPAMPLRPAPPTTGPAPTRPMPSARQPAAGSHITPVPVPFDPNPRWSPSSSSSDSFSFSSSSSDSSASWSGDGGSSGGGGASDNW